jgi:multidrug efflux pump subunit AcrA (membrane-fusion protein)
MTTNAPVKWPSAADATHPVAPQGAVPATPDKPARGSPTVRLLLPMCILALALGGFFALRATRPATQPVPIQETAWRVDAMEVTPEPHVPQLLLYGTVEAPREANLSAAIAADVTEVLVAEGQRVEAGQPLVVLDDRDIALILEQRDADVAEIDALIDSEMGQYRSDLAALEREQAMLALDRKAVARAADLQQRKMGSQSLLEEAQERQGLSFTERKRAVDDHPARLAQYHARLKRAEALRAQARLDLTRTRLTAPFAGRVAKVPVAPGDRVRVGDLLVQVYALGDLEVRAQIPFRYLPLVRDALEEGTTLTATGRVDGHELRTDLVRLGGEAVKGVGGVDALFRVRSGEQYVVPGRLFPLVLDLPAQAQTVALPQSALYGLDRIYRLEQDRMVALEVERIGERRVPDGDEWVLVRSSELKPGDRVITTQLPNAITGLRVTVQD